LLYRSGKRSSLDLIDTAWFEKNFDGLSPEAHADILAMAGDAADCVPGLKVRGSTINKTLPMT